jgi:DNA-directed RNA polymerase subunit omega
MASIPQSDRLNKFSNRFEMTLGATYRARQLANGAEPMIEGGKNKPTVVALREVEAGKIGPEILVRNQHL